MNKSKFLKRSLAALLAILMVVAMIPSALAADDDETEGQDLKITVDTYSATRTADGDYEVTVWDSNDVTINWASITGTTLTLVTGGKNPNVRLGLPQKLYLAENANIVGENVYSVTLMEKVGSAEEVPHKLTITVESTIPDWNANLSAVRVDKASGKYEIGYLTGDKLAGYDIKQTNDKKMEAHAIKGEIDDANETVTITLPFGMTPDQAGFGNGDITNPALVFATESVHAKVAVTGDATKNRVTDVTVTAMDGTTKTYKVVYKQEKIFESFTGETNLSDLETVPDTGLSQLDVELTAKDLDLSKYYDYTHWTDEWVPEFTTTASVQRIMGDSNDAQDTDKSSTLSLEYVANGAGSNNGEGLSYSNSGSVDSIACYLKLITSEHASWAVGQGNNKATDYVYLLVRTKANPLGAFLQINLKAVEPAPDKAYITEVQTEDTESVCDISKDTRLIKLTVDDRYSFKLGATPDNTDANDPAANMTLHINTSADSTIDLPQLESGAANNTDGKWWRDSGSTDTHHIIKGVMGKSGSVLVRVISADKSYIDYTINFVAATSEGLGMKQIQLRKSDGTLIQSAVVDSDDKHTFYLKVPYSYHAGAVLNSQISNALQGCQLLVFPDAGAVVKPGNTKEGGSYADGTDAFENGITKMSDVWKNTYTLDTTGNASGFSGDVTAFDQTLLLTVSNGKRNDVQVYQLVLQREKPLEDAEITAVTANKALDDDYIFSVASTLGTQTGNTKDVGQAYAGAIDNDGNELPATVDETTKTIKIQVPYDWDNDNDTLYLTGVTKAGYSFHRLQNTVASDGTITYADKLNNSLGSFVLNTIEQEDQTNMSGNSVSWMVGFTNLTTSPATTRPENILYVFSEKDRFPNVDDVAITPSKTNIKDKATKAYRVYIEKVGNANTGNALSGVSSDKVTTSFNSSLGMISVTVPGSYNWNSFREDSSKDFKLTFSTSAGALVIDKQKYDDNAKVATDDTTGALKTTDGKYISTRTGRVSGADGDGADAKVYLEQLNEYYDLNNATFFVKDGELYTYDELSGKETQVTGLGTRFTNSNWGAIKTKQAEIRVYREDQSSFRNYRLDLVVGAPSSANSITSLKVGETEAAISGSVITATLPEGSDSEQALTIEYSDFAAASVNGEPYQASRLIDITKPVTIVVTAEDGTEATYTLTVTFGGGTTPDPDKPSSKYTDLDKVTNDTMRDYVRRAIDMGLMTNTGREGIFDPMAIVSRKDFAVIIARADLMANNEDITNKDEADARLVELYGGEDAFDDISGCNPTQKAAIKYCAEKSYIAGNGKGGFNPNSSIERQAAAIVLAKWRGLTVDESNTGNVNNVADWDKVANWAKPYVNAVMTDGLMSGTGNNNFTPAGANGTVNREQTAVMLVRVFDKKYPAFE